MSGRNQVESTLACDNSGRCGSRPQLQVLRNHTCGRTVSGAASGPRLKTVIFIRTSSDICLGIFDKDIKVAIFSEDSGIDKLVLAIVQSAACDFRQSAADRESAACGYLYSMRAYEHVGVASR